MSTRVPYPAQVPKLPAPRRLTTPPPQLPDPESPVPDADFGAPDAADAPPVRPQNPVYQRAIEANAPAAPPPVPTASTDWKSRLKYGAIAAIQNMANTAASMPKMSTVPMDGPETLLGGLGAAAVGIASPQTIENERYQRQTIPQYQEQEKAKAGVRDSVLKSQKTEADINNVQAQEQSRNATTQKTNLDSQVTAQKLPYVRQKEELGIQNDQQGLKNKRLEATNLALRPNEIKARTEGIQATTAATKAMTPLREEGAKLANQDKAFEVKTNPEKFQTQQELNRARADKLRRDPNTTGKVSTLDAKDAALTEWNSTGEKALKAEFFKSESAKLAAQNPEFASAETNEKLRLLENRWNKVAEKHKKDFIEKRSLDSRNSQRGKTNSGTILGADAMNILYGGTPKR